MATTIKDIAEHAGCSIATVSRFVNGTAVLSVETRARIEAAINTLGYRPSELGRSLRRQATRTIGVIVPSLTNPVFAASVAGLQTRARETGFGVLIASTEYDPAQEMAAVNTFLGQGVDGVALTVSDALASPALSVLDAERKPHVLVYNQADHPDRFCVTVDNVAAAHAMTNAMLAEGHRRVAFLAGRFSASDRSRLRYRGFANAMAEAGFAPPAPTEVDFLADMPDQALLPLFELDAPPTALFCSNDILALAAIGALRRLGLGVPSDVSVVGFDGISLGRMVEPPLATVCQPAREMGEAAMNILLDQIHARAGSAGMFMPFELRLGGTLAAMSQRSRSSDVVEHSKLQRPTPRETTR